MDPHIKFRRRKLKRSLHHRIIRSFYQRVNRKPEKQMVDTAVAHKRYPDNILRSSSCCLRRLGKQITDRPADTAIQLLRPVLQHIISPLHHVSPILALRIQHTSDRQFSSGPGVHKIHHHRGRAHICRRQKRIFYVSRKRSRIHYCLFSVFCMSLGQNLCVLFPFP